MSEPRSNTVRRSLVLAVMLVMSGLIAFGRLQFDGLVIQNHDAYLHFAAFATIALLAIFAWPGTGLSKLFAGLTILAGLTELLQFTPGLNRTPSWSDFGFNICGIATMLCLVAVARAMARR